MRRRKFLRILGGAAAAWPLAVRAQQPDRTRRVAVLMLQDEDDPESKPRIAALIQGLQQLDWSVGRSLQIDIRWGAAERAIADFAHGPNGGLIVAASPGALVNRKLIIDMATRHRLPSVYFQREFVRQGGLISYGPDVIAQYLRATVYVDRILKGEKPADLPVQAPTKYETVINLKTAKAIGLDMPAPVLARADEVIE
jgi:putative ABC transport system substrate-binding protein